MISEHVTELGGLSVKEWSGSAKPADFKQSAFKISLEYDEAGEGISLGDKLAELLDAEGSDALAGIVIGSWTPDDSQGTPADVVEHLVSARTRLPNLRHLFLGDITGDENEISWIQQTDLSPLMAAYDKLETLVVRGGEGLSFGTLNHSSLKSLTIQSGGLPPAVIHEIGAAKLPALEHLELWLGTPNYGGDATVDDLAPLLRAGTFPKLQYLGLKDSVIQDEIAGVVALAPVLKQLKTLDLSLGNLGDAGAEALLASPAIRNLQKLDLSHHYLSEPVMDRLNALGIDVDLSDAEDSGEDADDRYIVHSE
jgi:hypothetical protein